MVLLAALLAALFLTLFAALGAAAFFSEAAGVLAGGAATGDSGLVFFIAFSINNKYYKILVADLEALFLTYLGAPLAILIMNYIGFLFLFYQFFGD